MQGASGTIIINRRTRRESGRPAGRLPKSPLHRGGCRWHMDETGSPGRPQTLSLGRAGIALARPHFSRQSQATGEAGGAARGGPQQSSTRTAACPPQGRPEGGGALCQEPSAQGAAEGAEGEPAGAGEQVGRLTPRARWGRGAREAAEGCAENESGKLRHKRNHRRTSQSLK